MARYLGHAFLLFLFFILSCDRPTEDLPRPGGNALIETSRLEGQVDAPEFPGHLEWLNTDRPLFLRDLRGKVVLLDFWTFCCINCMHVLPELRRLEEKYVDELVVIGVHSAKFTNEKQTQSIRQAILRYDIKHAVLNDKDFEVWNQYGVHAWPTLVLIAPNGKIIGTHSGEDIFDLFDGVIGQTAEHFAKKGELKRGPLELSLEVRQEPKTLLSFPGKIAGDAKGTRLLITDSNHHRILMASHEGNILDVIGSGRLGSRDGSFEEAEFQKPQGTFLEGETLYIADTENHLIRAADFKTRQVKTLLGTGKKSQAFNQKGIGTQIALNSPWDLLVHRGKLYIAMAGPHQIWVTDLRSFETRPYAGSGREGRIDGPLLEAALAQPSGITAGGAKLYFADSEVSSIRSADLDPKGRVETLIGEDLFEYGDIDGPQQVARLQHALGVLFYQGKLYVADTYNSKIKLIDPLKKTSATYAGTGKHGTADGPRLQAEFHEPGGLTVLEDSLYIADTNNHQIRVLNFKTQEVRTLRLRGLEKLEASAMKTFSGRTIELPPAVLQKGEAIISLSIKLPAGYKFTPEAPFYLDWKARDESVVRFNADKGSVMPESLPLDLQAQTREGKTELIFDAVVYYCRKDSTVCFFDEIRLKLPIEVKERGTSKLPMSLEVKIPT